MSSNKSFVPMYNIERLDEEQKAQYYRDACDFFGVPANLNLLAFIQMNVGDTGRHEVLYAKKGATDIIRDAKGITTITLEVTKDLNIPGQICFTAVGKNKDGREERAVGAATIDGLRGKALSDAIMTAQTRATRRMTLQFVGGGLLDETEVTQDQVTTLINNVALDAIQHQPVVLPNNEIGRVVEPTEAQKDAQKALEAVKPEVLATAAGEVQQFKTVAELAAALPPDNPLVLAADVQQKRAELTEATAKLEQAVAEPPRQRKRKPAGITLNTPAQEAVPTQANSAVPVQVDSAKTLVPLQMPEVPKEAVAIVAEAQKQAEVITGAMPVQPPVVQKLLTEEQEKECRTRLAKYRNEILPGKPPAGGNMVPVEGIGGVEIQLRTFVSKFNPAKPSSKQWDYSDWKRFLDFFDDVVKNEGAIALVLHIQKTIGIVK